MVKKAVLRHWRMLVILANFVFWIADGLHEWFTRGLFLVAGVDWARFWGAARAFDAVKPAAAYRLPQIAIFMQPLGQYARPHEGGVRIGPAPYPPLFLKLFAIFTLPPPPIGFLLWTLFNVALAFFVARRLARRFRPGSRWAVTLILLSSFPLMMAFFVGQMVVLLLACVMQAVTEFERGREFQAGVWTGLLVLKPQYAICFPLIYLFKRRTAALSGFMLGAAIIGLGSLAAGGVGGVLAYGRMLMNDYPAYAGGVAIDPRGMIGWRAIVLTLLPHLSARPSLLLVALLSLLTLGLLPLIWQGCWNATSDRFAGQLLATFAVTLLVAYHSQPHGAALLMAPASIVVARAGAGSIVRRLLIGAVAVAPVLGLVSALAIGNLSLVSIGMSGVLIALLAVFVYNEATMSPVVEPLASAA